MKHTTGSRLLDFAIDPETPLQHHMCGEKVIAVESVCATFVQSPFSVASNSAALSEFAEQRIVNSSPVMITAQ